ncbi:hypothetical protein SDJN03_13871, partial [Cucurbita argyrosperma subsp. sororia]
MSSVKFIVLINYQATIEPRRDEITTELGANRAATTGAGTWWEMRLEKYPNSPFLLLFTTTLCSDRSSNIATMTIARLSGPSGTSPIHPEKSLILCKSGH